MEELRRGERHKYFIGLCLLACLLLFTQLDMSGESRMERATVDSVTTTLNEALEAIVQFQFVEKDAERREQLKTKAYREDFPRLFSFVEAVLKANNNGQGFLVGKRLTIADISIQHLFFILSLPDFGGADVLELFPALQALCKRVESQPNLAGYLAKRNAQKKKSQ